MTEWKTVKLSDLGEIVGGATPSTSREEYYNGDIPWLTPKDLAGYQYRYIEKGERNITKAGLESCSAKIMPKNTVLFTSRAPIGYVAIAQNDICTNQGFKSIVPNDQTDYLFLYYLLKYNKDKIEAMGSGTTFKEVSGSTMREIEVKVPRAKDIQRKIAQVLDSIDSKIDNNRKINDNLLQQAMALFVQKFIENPPCGEYRPLYDFADYINGAAFKQDDYSPSGLPIIKIAELKNGISGTTQFFAGNKGEKYLIHDKDILFSWSGNPDTSIDIFIWALGDGILNQHTFNVKSKEGFRWFMYLMLKYFKPQFTQIASNKQTTGLGHVTAVDLKRLTFIYNRDEIASFEKMIEPTMEIMFSNMLENRNLLSLRDSLLPRLMSGEINISDIAL